VNAHAELELNLSRRGNHDYDLELRFSQPASDADIRLLDGRRVLVQIDQAALRELESDPASYGRVLGQNLFGDPIARRDIGKARAIAQSLNAPLRMRLAIGSDAPELHTLRWETLRDPQDETLLFTGEQVLFSRYLSGNDWRRVQPRAKGDLRALVMIANPLNLTDYNIGGTRLAPVDVSGELDRARASLGSIPIVELASGGSATLANLVAQLRNGFDILYLVAHGALVQDRPWLWLEDEQGRVARVPGDELATRLGELAQRPLLVVLASCESAGRGASVEGGAVLAALGPRLAEVGVSAVLAMQGRVSMETVARFMPVFFQELQRDGQIDRAVAVARGTVRERPDFWMPALFLRLRSGRIWYTPAFAISSHERVNEKWQALITNIFRAECTPILGPDLIEGLIGSQRDLARTLANEFHYPLTPSSREDLPQVTQFLAVHQSAQDLSRTIIQHLFETIRERQGYLSPATQDVNIETASMNELMPLLDTLLSNAWRTDQAHDPAEPHSVLASLPFPIYLTADPSDLLVRALVEAGRSPQVMLCPWNDYTRRDLPRVDEPDPQHPLVYQLFGRLSMPDSLVLTEDNFFDYLIGVTRNHDLIPARLRLALSDTALLFLGFHTDDWTFRILFRSLLGQEGRCRRSRYPQIAVQVAPEEGRILDPTRAQRYLEEYFSKGAAIDIYWGSGRDFLRDLAHQWNRS
jgi:hypothetical protein